MIALRALPASLLAATSAVLAGASKLAELGARRLAPPSRASRASRAPDPAPTETAVPQPVVTLDDVVAHPTPSTPPADVPDVLDQGEVEQGLEVAADVVDQGLDRDPDADIAIVLDQVEADADAEAEADLAADAADAGLAVNADIVAQAAEAALGATLPPAPDDTGIVADLPPTDASILDDLGGQARTYESHIAELADRNASEVVRGIQDLSTEELGQLFDYESAHRKRKTVLQAIERAAAPSGQGTVASTQSADYLEGNPPL